MKLLFRLIELNNSVAGEFRSSKIVYLFMLIQTLQLASLITIPAVIEYSLSNPLLQTFLRMINYASITAWESVSTSREISIIFTVYLVLFAILQLDLIYCSWRGKSSDFLRITIFFYKIWGFTFEYILFIPILSWIFFIQLPITYSLEGLNEVMNTSPRWLFIACICLFCFVSLMHLIGKFVHVPFHSYSQEDKLKGTNVLFEIFQFLMPICIAVLAAKASNSQVPGISPVIAVLLHSVISMVLDVCYLGFKNTSTKRFHILLMSAYFVHSTIILIARELQDHGNTSNNYVLQYTFREYSAVIYFISLPCFMKICDTLYKVYLESSWFSRNRSFSFLSRHRKFEEMISLLHGSADKVATLAHRKMFISRHINSCNNESCFCRRWAHNQSDSPSNSALTAPQLLELSLETSQSFVEACYEDLLKKTQERQGKQDIWSLVDLVLFQAISLQKPLRACMILERFKGSDSSFYQRIILKSLISYLTSIFLNSLGTTDREFCQMKFLNGLMLDASFRKILQEYQSIKAQMSEFYQYLVETSPVDLNVLYQKGRKFIKDAKSLEELLENQILKGCTNPETFSLMIDFKLNILGWTKHSVKALQSQRNIIHLNNEAALHNRVMIENPNNPNEMKYIRCFKLLDYNNIYLAIDLVDNVGEIVNHSSKLYSDLGYNNIEKKLSLKTVLPHQIFKPVEQTIRKLLNSNQGSLESGRKYLDLVLLSHVRGYLVPYEGYAKIELTGDDRTICGAVVLRRIQSESQFILTNPSGEVISVTDTLLSWLDIESLELISGLNICLLIPDLLKYYLGAVDEEELYPNNNVESGKFEAAMFLQEQTVQKRSNINSLRQAVDILHFLNKKNSQGKGERLQRYETRITSRKLSSFKSEISRHLQKKFQITLKVRRYDLDEAMFKVIEIIGCLSLTGTAGKSSYSGGYGSEPAQRRSQIESISIPKNLKTLEESYDAKDFDIPLEGQINASEHVQKTLEELKSTDQISEFEPQSRTDRPLLLSQKKFQMNELTLQTQRDEPLPTIESLLKESKLLNSNRMEFQESLMIKINENATETNIALKDKEELHAFDQLALSPKQAFSLGSSQKGECSRAVTIKNSFQQNELKFDLKKPVKELRFGKASQSSKPSSKHTSKGKLMIRNRMSYRVLQINFLIGLLGVVIILALFTAQYVGYNQRLNELILLSISLKYPMLLGLNLQMLTKEYYKWDLVNRGLLTPPSWYKTLTITNNFQNYLNVSTKYENLMMNGTNVSSDVSIYLSNWQNSVAVLYPNGDVINMSLTLGALVTIQAGKQYYSDNVLGNSSRESSKLNGFILEYDTNIIYDKLLDMNSYLYNVIEQRISDILNFNVILISVVSFTITVLAFSCLYMYIKIQAKNVKMLSLFCTIQKSSLKREYQNKENLGKKNFENSIMTTEKKEKKFGKRLLTDYVHHHKNRQLKYAALLFVFSLFILPFVYVFIQNKQQTEATMEGVQQLNTLIQFEAYLASFLTEEFNYYRNLGSNPTYVAAIQALKQTDYEAAMSEYPGFQSFLTEFGQLSNQDAFQKATSQLIIEGLTDVCDSLSQPNVLFVSTCKTICSGIANQGIIPTINYIITMSEDIYNNVSGETNHTQALLDLQQNSDIISVDFMQLAANRFIRLITESMANSFVIFMQSISQQALNTFIVIALIVLLVLGSGWIIWIRRLEISLNDTKDIYRILPKHILENSTLIKNYLKKETQSSLGLL